jgi:hypothetical protein
VPTLAAFCCTKAAKTKKRRRFSAGTLSLNRPFRLTIGAYLHVHLSSSRARPCDSDSSHALRRAGRSASRQCACSKAPSCPRPSRCLRTTSTVYRCPSWRPVRSSQPVGATLRRKPVSVPPASVSTLTATGFSQVLVILPIFSLSQRLQMDLRPDAFDFVASELA